MPDDLATDAENTWCPGCGNFGIINAFKRAVRELEARGIGRDTLFITAGIGCHGKIFDYLRLNGLYSLHGRSMATAQGFKLGNPDLKVVAFAGDGDAMGEGFAHVMFAAKRNADITVIMHDNGVYGLTTGQVTPTSSKGFRGKSTPRGSVEEPMNPLALVMEAGATFVARGFSGKLDLLKELFVAAVEHEGFSFVQVLQPCVSFNDTYKLYNEIVEAVGPGERGFDEAMALAKRTDRLPIGVFYDMRMERPAFHKALYGDWNPVVSRLDRKERLERVERMLRV